jgi:hypothetical protein
MMPTASDTGTLLYRLFQEELRAGPRRLIIFRAFAEYITTGSLGRFEGFLNALVNVPSTTPQSFALKDYGNSVLRQKPLHHISHTKKSTANYIIV